MTVDIPLSLYIHIPWCIKKCPYCDFNSHQVKSEIPEREYVAHLLNDLEEELANIKKFSSSERELMSIFIGGGTPSLFSPEAISILLQGVEKRIAFSPNIEITMEANPGTVDLAHFSSYPDSGVNRISMGIQSFQSKHLQALGRIHNAQQSHAAIDFATQMRLRSFNTDIMHGLPEQSIDNALDDLHQAILHAPPHLSWYQLTIEPNTLFYSKPPTLPIDDVLWDIQIKGQALLEEKGYKQYEISAYSKEGHQCEHNLNYWRYGDYIGIGCGSHGKLTHPKTGKIERRVKIKHPKGYMNLTQTYLHKSTFVSEDDFSFEFFMNRFRLLEPIRKESYETHTLRKMSAKDAETLDKVIQLGLLKDQGASWQVSDNGRRYLNSLLEYFV